MAPSADSPRCLEFGLTENEFIVADCFSLKKISFASVSPSVTSVKVFERTITSVSKKKLSSLMAVGLENGDILIFDILSKSILRKLGGHKARINQLAFFASNTWLISCSDDGSVKMWDFSMGECLASVQHADHVRSISLSEEMKRIFSSSYDGNLSMWAYDGTANLQLIHQINIQGPIEAICYSASKLYVGGMNIQIYTIDKDEISESSTIKCHHRAITQLYVNEKTLVSSSLDKSLKFHSVDLRLQQRIKFLSCVRCFLVTGTNIIIAKNSGEVVLFSPTKPQLRNMADINEKLSTTDILIRSHKYRAAFDEAFSSNDPVIFFSVFAQLVKLNALFSSLSGRSEDEVLKFIQFVRPHSIKGRFSPYVRIILEELIENYASTSSIIRELSHSLREFRHLHEKAILLRRLMPLLEN